MLVSVQQKFFGTVRTNMTFGAIGSLSFAVFTSLGARMVIPLSFSPVPITMQTFFVLASGMVLGRKFGTLSQMAYLLFAALGILQFAGGKTGISVIFGATGGYLIGFVLAAYIVGRATESYETRKNTLFLASLILATLMIYITGILGLMIALGIEISKAMLIGMFPFMPGDFLKIMLAFVISKPILPQKRMEGDVKIQYFDILFFVIPTIVFTGFVIYLFSNGNSPPPYLPTISILLSLFFGLIAFMIIKRNTKNTI